MWGVTDQGMVSLNTMPALKGDAREASLAQMSQAFAMLKAQHWTEEKKEFPNGYCSIMTPPPSQKDVPISSGCFTEAKGMALGAGFMRPTQRLSIEKTKALLDKAVSRIP